MLDQPIQAQARPHGPLAGFAPIRTALVAVEVGPAQQRSVLRGQAAPGWPAKVGQSLEHDGCAMLCLGPDEWLVLGPWNGTVVADVGHRQVALLVSGAQAEELLNAGCPLDLHVSQFPVGACTRTLLGKTDIVLWRRGAALFHLEVARSFAFYAWTFLETAATMLP